MSWSVRKMLGPTWRDEALAQNPECGDQFDAAKAAVAGIIASGAVGDPKGKFEVAMSGHANPDHAPRQGWANDQVVISITQAV